MSIEDVEAHVRKADRDESIVSLAGESIGDWVIVLRFYVALHTVQAYLLTKNVRFEAKRHGDRLRAIRESPELRLHIEQEYRRLQDVSEQVRYDPGCQARLVDLQKSVSDLSKVRVVLQPKIARHVEGQGRAG